MSLSEKAPPILRQISVRAVMETLLYKGPRSRADLAKETKLSKQTMSEVIKAAQEAGWVREKGVTKGHVGRAAILYEVDPTAGYVLGMDIGATRFRFSLVDITGELLGEAEHTALKDTPTAVMDGIAAMAEALIVEAGAARDRLLFCTLATPGVVDPESGRLTMAPNLSSLASFDLAEEMRRRLSCDVVIENDVNAAVLGESWTGAAKDCHTAAYVGIGTGVGLGVTIDGTLIRGASGAAGEVGYLPIGTSPKESESLERGALERALGLNGMIALYRTNCGDATSVTTAAELLALLEEDSPAARKTLEDIGEIGALLIASVQAMFDPSIIIVGGVLGQEDIIFKTIEAHVPQIMARPVHMVPTSLRRRATLVGASAIALRRLHKSLFEPDLEGPRRNLPPLNH